MVFLIIHLFISLIVGMIRLKHNKIESLCYFILSLFFPIGGFILALFLMLKTLKRKEIEDDFEEEEIYLLTDRINQENKDIVSIEDFLTFSDTHEKRRSIIEVLKRDSSGYIDKLRLALLDSDSETAHYAASAITEFKRQIDLKLQRFAFESEKDDTDLEVINGYLEVLEEYINSGLLDDGSKKQYQNMMIDILYKAIDLDSSYHKSLIDNLIKTDRKHEAGELSKVFLDQTKNEDAYISRLKYLFTIQDKPGFDQVFDALLNSEVQLNHQAMSILRFWIKEVDYVKY